MASIVRRVVFFVGVLITLSLSLSGSIYLIARLLGLHANDVTKAVRSPDGSFVASVVRSDQAFSSETLVTLSRSDGSGDLTVVAYEVPSEVDPTLSWSDPFTLRVGIPCTPPNLVRPAYWDEQADHLRRVIVEVAPRSPGCRFSRGVRPTAGWLEETEQ